MRRALRNPLLGPAAAAILLARAGPALALPGGIPATSCTGCHLSVNVPTTSVCIDGLPVTGFYDPNTTYAIQVIVNGVVLRDDGGDPAAARAGFSLHASSGTLATLPDGYTLSWGPAIATHSLAGNVLTEWNLTWTPQDSATSTTFSLAGNAVDGDGDADTDGGDVPNRGDFTFTALPGVPAVPGRTCSVPPLPAPIYVPDTDPWASSSQR